MSTAECEAIMSGVADVTDNEICTVSQSDQATKVEILMVTQGGTWEVAGVFDFGVGSGSINTSYPTVYTNVPAYLDWITQNEP
jgi:hypothetical protein